MSTGPTQPEPFNRLKQCRHGQMLYNVHDMYIGRSLDLYGEFSEGEIELFRQIVRPAGVVVEVGANIGSHTVFLAALVGPSGVVLAFEPQRVVFQTLCANLALGSHANVFAFQQAVGAAAGTVVVPSIDYRQNGNFGGLELGSYQQGEQVPVVAIDSFALSRCNFIKIDVEGMEQAVIAGAAQTLARHKPVLYVENDRADRAPELIRYLDSLGYAMYWHLPPLYSPANFFANSQNVFGTLISQNMLCIHRDQEHELQGFERVQVPAAAPAAATATGPEARAPSIARHDA